MSHDTQDSTSLLKAIDEEIDDVIQASLNKVLIHPSQLTATASSSHSSYPDPTVVVDGRGMVSETEHSSTWGSWFTAGDDPDRWIVVDLGGTYTLKEVHIWNANEAWGWSVLGFNETAIYVANMANPGNPVDNAANWTIVTTQVLNEAPGTAGYNSPETVNLLRLTGTHAALQCVQPTWYYGDQRAGLSELQFYSVALRADIDNDNDVDILDLQVLVDNWLGKGDNLEGDFNGDGQIDMLDLAILGEDWLTSLQE